MPPNSSGAVKPLVNISMRRAVPPGAGSTTPLALQRSEFEDFANAYRPTLDVPRREPPEPPPPRTVEDSKVDFGRSIKKLMKRPQGSPSIKNNRKSGIQRTPTVVLPSGSHSDNERSSTGDVKPMSEKKQKRPLSANIETTVIPSPPPAITISGYGSAAIPPAEVAKLSKPDVPSQPQQSPVPAPASRKSIKVPKNGPDDHLKVAQESTLAPPMILAHEPPPTIPNQVKKKVSIQEDNRRSGTEVYPDAHCLIISGNNIGRFLPPRHNPDPILSMRVMPIPERKYHVILEFEESPLPPPIQNSTSGLTILSADADAPPATREQLSLFSWIRETHVAATGMLLMNVERITDFPFVTYLVVNGGRHELAQKVQCVGSKPMSQSLRQLHFLAGYEETITISRPPATTFPEKPDSSKTGYVISLYQVLPGEDGLKFEQNWVMWTGARQLYRTIPDYMGLKRISVHKSILPTQTINYCVICELSNVMDHLTDACVVIDHLRARCCGFTGIYRIIDAL